MKIYDYHTHNGYSGCASKAPYSVKQGWKKIQEKNISKWGISNHFPTAKIYGDYLPKLRQEIDEMHENNILLGVELDLQDEQGNCPLKEQDKNVLDYIIGAVHNLPRGFLKLPDIQEEEIQEFFDSFRDILINGFTKIPIKIWAHPFLQEFQEFGDLYWKKYMKTIFEETLDIMAQREIALELTPSYHRKCQSKPITFKILDEMYDIAMKNKEIMFVTSCDSHSVRDLGELKIPLEYVKKLNIPQSRLLVISKKE